MAAEGRAERLARDIISRLFLKTRIRMGLTVTPRGDRRLTVEANPRLSVVSLYEAAVRAGGGIPRLTRLAHLRRVASGYLEAQKEAAVAAVSRVVGGVVGAADLTSRVVLPDQVRKDLIVGLDTVLQRLRPAVERIVSTEAVAARNFGDLEIVQRQGQQAGVADPATFFVVVRDGQLCGECRRVHLMPDGITPRVWRQSEISGSYHRRGEDRPSAFGMHPNCRCRPRALLPNYGFDERGMLTYVGPGHDELARQRKGT